MKLTRRTVAAATTGTHWDDQLPGFGLRVRRLRLLDSPRKKRDFFLALGEIVTRVRSSAAADTPTKYQPSL